MYWFIFYKSDLVLEKTTDGGYTIPLQTECPVALKETDTIHNITPMEDGTAVKTVRLDAPITDNPRYEMHGLRDSFHLISIPLYLKAGKCQEINHWDSETRYCGSCGAPMKLHTDISKVCTGCGKEIWPLLATAVIVLIRKKNISPEQKEEVLLVRAKSFRGNHYGLVAGFVETGESLEEAVHREVKEETGLTISNLQYFGSQPWPYPCGLMVGYTADYVSGKIHIQEEELKTAGWFSRDNLPAIPQKMSIARKLIDAWLGV